MNTPNATQTSLNIKEILTILPHGYPFVMVDRILNYVPNESIIGLKNVTINEPFFQGHFPGNPIMPGVLMLEGMAQTSGILIHESIDSTPNNSLFVFAGLDDKPRFRGIVKPGDQLIIKATLTNKITSKLLKFSCEAFVEEKKVANSTIILRAI